MASETHKRLAAVIKSVHRDLRRQYQSCKDDQSAAKLWEEHCSREEVLSNYASAMHTLANIHWKQNNSSTRIDWCYSTIMDYYVNGGMMKALEKDMKRDGMMKALEKDMKRMLKAGKNVSTDMIANANCLPIDTKIRLLDVGSCYNPFSEYDTLSTVAVDIWPATPDVFKCDFLNLEVISHLDEDVCSYFRKLSSPIRNLPENGFHVIVFSLFLEYLPSPHQRLLCCKKASELLMENGLLLIISPDSKHQNHNAKMMKSWKLTLEFIGLRRMKYEKQMHIHCLAFRKTPKEFRKLMATEFCDAHEGLYIPQDFHDYNDSSTPTDVEASLREASQENWNFDELPYPSGFE